MADFLPTNQLDFISLRENLKTYLQSNTSPFKDYDYDGSNLSTLLDLLSYNTYLNSFYLNMVGNEMFLDSAVLRDSVTSHAKALNYTARSYTSAKATVDINIAVTNTAARYVTLPKYTKFTATASGGTYTFSTGDNIIISRNANNQFTANVDIFEGFVVTEKYVANTMIDNQRFVISNKQVDTSSLTVRVAPLPGQNYKTYLPATTLYDLNGDSEIYFTQCATQDRYEIIFGDGVFGKALTTGNVIEATYRVSSGSAPNGLKSFTSAGSIEGYSVTVNTITPASGGAERESIQSIKYNAPRHFQTQGRAVTPSDYNSLLLAKYPEIKSVYVYGGEEIPLTPKYGTVVVSIATVSGNPLTSRTKTDIVKYLRERSPLAINPILADPEYLDLIVTSDVVYNTSTTTLTPTAIQAKINTSVSNFNSNNLLEFNKTFRYSKFITSINNADSAIISNETSVTMAKTIVPEIGVPFSAVIDFGNQIKKDDALSSRPTTNEFSLYSSQVTYNNKTAYIGEDGGGTLFVYEFTDTGRNVLNKYVGTVDYDNGIVLLSNLVITDFVGEGITFYAGPRKQDIKSQRNTIIRILTQENVINVTPVIE